MDKRTILIAFAAVVSAGAAWAHHGWGSYDATKAFTISAPVESLVWANPHSHVMLKSRAILRRGSSMRCGRNGSRSQAKSSNCAEPCPPPSKRR